MTFLTPWGWGLAAAVAVPLVLHLWRRRAQARVEFPAVRYLLRMEREHAREVRLHNVLLMLLRVGIVLALALAAGATALALAACGSNGGSDPTTQPTLDGGQAVCDEPTIRAAVREPEGSVFPG